MRDVLLPLPLALGDRAAVLAPASPADPEALVAGVEILSRRYRIDVLPSAAARAGYLAGDDSTRAADLQRTLDDPEVRAIIATRGGFGTSRILDRLNTGRLRRSPKWLVGSSDLTALCLHVYNEIGLCTIHGPMAAGLGRAHAADLDALFDLLEGRPQKEIALSPMRSGTVTGPLVGGNLTVIAHLTGTLSADIFDDAVLFLEDVGEKPYRLDRCLTQLARAGLLRNLKGFVFGDFTDCAPNADGISALNVMTAFAADLRIPAAFGYPAAHGSRNFPFVHGIPVQLEVTASNAMLRFEI